MLNKSLLSLLHLCDPNLPIGGFSHSAGLETYVQRGIVKDIHSAKDFITGMLCQSIQFTDAAFVSLAYDAAEKKAFKSVIDLDMECTAVKLPTEMRWASQKLGIRLIKLFHPLLQIELIDSYRKAIGDKEACGHYCLAFGIIAQALAIPKIDALAGFYYNAAVGMITNCVKLIPLGQQDGQQLLFSLHLMMDELAQKSLSPNRALIGVCCTGFDIRCMQHENLYSRLYMS
jgi:urease accessory protein